MSAAPVDVNENEAEQGDGHDGDRPTASTSQAGDIQILDLSGQNPIISYQNQVYYCTWSDMVGTAMFFSKHEAKLEEEALLSTDNFHLINTSRIKLIGQKAKAVEKPGKKRRRQLDHDLSNAIFMDDEYDNGISLLDGKSLGEIRTSNPSVNADIKRQAAFLEKLMNVKRAKGESDNVRTVFTQRKAAPKVARPQGTSDSPAPQRKDFPSLEKEIQELNRLVVRGDASALKRLQDIYSSMEDDAPNLSSQQKSSATPSQTPQNGLNSATMFEQRPQSNN